MSTDDLLGQDPTTDERLAQFLRGDYARSILLNEHGLGKRPPEEILVTELSAGQGQEDTGAAWTDNNVGFSAGANVTGGSQIIGHSHCLCSFPKIEGYRREVQIRSQFNYYLGGTITGANLTIWIRNAGSTSAYVPYSASRATCATPNNWWSTGVFNVNPNNNYAVGADAYVVGMVQKLSAAYNSSHFPDGWIDIEDDIPATVDIDQDGHWTTYWAVLGNASGGGAWRPIFRSLAVYGRYIEVTN